MMYKGGQIMAAKKVGDLIKEARTGAGLTQEALARKVSGLTAAQISRAERGEIDLTQAQLKEIAKATGVTQKSLLDAAKKSSTSGRKTGTSAAKKPASSSAGTRETLTAAEKRFLNLYRQADTKTRDLAKSILEGKDSTEILLKILGKKVAGSSSSSSDSGMSDLVGSLLGNVLGKKQQ